MTASASSSVGSGKMLALEAARFAGEVESPGTARTSSAIGAVIGGMSSAAAAWSSSERTICSDAR